MRGRLRDGDWTQRSDLPPGSSVPYFHYPRLDLLVEAAPSCLTDGRRAARPVIAGEHTFRRQEDDKDAYGDGIEEALAAAAG